MRQFRSKLAIYSVTKSAPYNHIDERARFRLGRREEVCEIFQGSGDGLSEIHTTDALPARTLGLHAKEG